MFISQAHAQAANQPPAGGEWFLPIMMIGLLVFMYFTTIRPQRKRQKEHAELVNSLGKGDEAHWYQNRPFQLITDLMFVLFHHYHHPSLLLDFFQLHQFHQ